LLLGLLVVAGVAYYVLQLNADSASVHSAPRQQLDNVRDRAKEIEQDSQKRADDLFKKSE
jgi:hypothetical protein